jgi:hypothetical protein
VVRVPAGEKEFSSLMPRPAGSVLLTQYCSGNNIEKNEMGRACGAYGEKDRCIQGFGGET